MAIVAGIDEAGFGPVLGPLVVSASAFAVPDELAGSSLWSVLAASVCQKPSVRAGGKVAINDSKQLYSGLRGKDGPRHLERGVLSVLAAGQRLPATLRGLVAILAPQALRSMDGYPWYAGTDLDLPHCLNATSVTLSGNALAADMARAGISLAALRAEPVFSGEFNRLVLASDNKASVLLDVTCRLLMHLWTLAGPRPLTVAVDRQGGRMYYLPVLQRVFEGCRFKIIEESETFSAYRITEGEKTAEVCFLVEAERQHLPVALASMTSKYLREMCMVLFNRFWAGHLPEIRPTAGYYGDGGRFYSEIGPAIKRLGLDERMIYRCR